MGWLTTQDQYAFADDANTLAPLDRKGGGSTPSAAYLRRHAARKAG